MKLGIGTYTYMWSIGFEGAVPERPMSALDLLAKGAELGVGVVQYGPNLALSSIPENVLDSLVQRSKKESIEIELGTRGLETEHLRSQIALADRMGAKLLRSVPELGDRTPSIAELKAALCAIMPCLERSNVRLAIENGNIPAQFLAQALDELASPHVGVTLDTVNSLAIPESTREVVKHLARHVFCFHVKDFVVKRVWHRMGFTVEGSPAGEGQMDFPWVLQELRSAGSDPNAILELWPPEQGQLGATIALEHAWARHSILNLRRYIPN